MMLRKNFFLICLFAIVLSIAVISHEGFCEDKEFREEIGNLEREMIREGDFDEATDKLTLMMADHPEDARVYLDMGLARYGLMEYEEAYGYFKGAEEKGPGREHGELVSYAISKIDGNRETLAGMEEASLDLGIAKGEEKEVIKERLAAGHLVMIKDLMMKEKYYYPSLVMPHIIWLKKNMPDIPGLYVFSADAYYSAMFYAKAAEDYEKAIEEDPENPRLYSTLADCLVAAGDFDRAQENYDKAIDLYKKMDSRKYVDRVLKLENIRKALPKRYEDIAELIEKRRFFEAEEICRKRISLNPADYAAMTQLGQIYWDQKKRKAAIKLFRRVIKLAPDYPTAHFYLGRAYFIERKPEKADKEFAIFKEKMDLLPKMDEDTVDYYASALHYIAYSYFTQKKYEEALKECRKIAEIKPDDQRAHYNIAVIYYVHYHNRSRAYQELMKVVEIDLHTRMADRAKFYIDYIRRNPDARIIGDFTFLEED